MGPRRVRAVLFDLDGTLIDSEPVYYRSDRAFLAAWGIDYTPAMNAAFTGRGAAGMMLDLEHMAPDSPIHALPLTERVRLKDEAYLAFAAGQLSAFPEVARLARILADAGVPLAIASGSSRSVIDMSLRATGLDGLFTVRVSSAEVASGKPAPDVFLEAAARLGAAPVDCLVVEDSVHGLKAALAAGMACIVLANDGGPGAHAGDSAWAGASMVVYAGAAGFRAADALDFFDWTPSVDTAAG